MPIFGLIIDVRLKHPLPDVDDATRCYPGFLMEAGITAPTWEEAAEKISCHIYTCNELGKGDCDIVFDHIGIIEPDMIDQEIYGDPDYEGAILHHPKDEGIWYLSGRGFYHNEDT